MTGFSAAVRLQIRTRAGHGDPDRAVCECHGLFLGRTAGEIQHRVARGMGGRGVKAPDWINTAPNGLMMCPAGHRHAESRADGAHDNGWWLRDDENPLTEPVQLYGRYRRWLTADGQYATAPPEGAAA